MTRPVVRGWRIFLGAGWIGSALLVGLCWPSIAASQEPDVIISGAPDDAGYEELTRGPVHEAFAQPVVFNAEAGPVVADAPPEAIEEIPPDEKPEGENVTWIPGYWSWDEDDSRFLWISGIWRAIPPGFEWVPGYWAESDGGGYQWVSGFWKKSDVEEIDYLPAPPESIEYGPVGDPPTDNHVWVPGTWLWNVSRYVWRPGYYLACRPGWIWVPSHYVWSPYGFIFVDGYWDYSIRRRGLLFAPICFPRGYAVVHSRPYVPRTLIDLDLFTSHLFCRPRVTNYCFGDYYAPRYMNAGVYPWFAFHMSRYGYDPVYSYYRWHHTRTDRTWADHVRADYRFRRDHEEARPPHTLIETRNLIGQLNVNANTKNLILTTSIAEFAKRPTTSVKFEKLPPTRIDQFRHDAHRWTEIQDKRRELELPPGFVRPGRPTPGKPDIVRPGPGKPDAIRPDLGRPDLGKPDPGKPDPGKPDLGRPDLGRPGSGRPGFGRPDAGKPDDGKPDVAKPDFGKPDIGKPDIGRPGLGKPDIVRPGKPDREDPSEGKPDIGKPSEGTVGPETPGPRPGRPTPGAFGKDGDVGPRRVKLPSSLAKGPATQLSGDQAPPPTPQPPRFEARPEPRTTPRDRPGPRNPNEGRPGPESAIERPVPADISDQLRRKMESALERRTKQPQAAPRTQAREPMENPPTPPKIERPMRTDPPKKFEPPKRAEPTRIETPRKVEPPRKLDSPPRNDPPRGTPPRNVDPPKIERPKREPPPRVDPPRNNPPKIERPRPSNNPPRNSGGGSPGKDRDREKPKKD